MEKIRFNQKTQLIMEDTYPHLQKNTSQDAVNDPTTQAANDPTRLDIVTHEGDLRPPFQQPEFSEKVENDVRELGGNTAILEAEGYSAAQVQQTNQSAEMGGPLPTEIQADVGAKPDLHPIALEQLRLESGHTLEANKDGLTTAQINEFNRQATTGTKDVDDLQAAIGAEDMPIGPDDYALKEAIEKREKEELQEALEVERAMQLQEELREAAQDPIKVPESQRAMVDNIVSGLDAKLSKFEKLRATEEAQVLYDEGVALQDANVFNGVDGLTPDPTGLEQVKERGAGRGA